MVAESWYKEDAGWREIHRYGYVDRPFEAVWNVLAGNPKLVLGDEAGPARDASTSDLFARLAGLDISRQVRVHFAGLVCDEDWAKQALRWEDASHPKLFPLLEAVLELAPLQQTAGPPR